MMRLCVAMTSVILSIIFAPMSMARSLPTEGDQNREFVESEYLDRCNIESTETKETWHVAAQCMRQMRSVFRQKGPLARLRVRGFPTISDTVRSYVQSLMSADGVSFVVDGTLNILTFSEVFTSDLQFRITGRLTGVFQSNDLGKPYNAMGQSGLSYFLYDMARVAQASNYIDAERDAFLYRSLARAMILTVLAPTSDNGLASYTRCTFAPTEICAWYHSVTRRDLKAEAGATLNQMLHVVRDLTLISSVVRKAKWDEPIDFINAAQLGLNQLLLTSGHERAGLAPNLSDFLSSPMSSGQRLLYYGYNTQSEARTGGYFLKKPYLTCHYQFHSLDLLYSVIQKIENTDIPRHLRDIINSCQSPVLNAFRLGLLTKEKGVGVDFQSDDPQRDIMSCSSVDIHKFFDNAGKFFITKFKSCMGQQ